MLTGLAIGAIVGTVCGYALCAMMVIGKEADKTYGSQQCTMSNCNKKCPGWFVCDDKW